MSGFYLAFVLTVIGMVLYHLSQKAVPKETNPFFVIVTAYVVGIVLCLGFAFTYPGKKGLIETFKASNWAVFTLGAAAALIELGFLLAYRSGWRISIAAVATNAAAAIVLIPLGLIAFKDQLSLRNVIGLILGVVLLVVVILACSGIGGYNTLVTKQQKVQAQWSQVENQMQRRADLIPNIVATVKGIAGLEERVFTKIAEARSQLLSTMQNPNATTEDRKTDGRRILIF